MSPPQLSICIPIYNFAKFIPETLDSIFANEGTDDVEVIVTDGASTDNTADVIAPYLAKHPNLRYVRLPAKGGIDRDMAKSVEPATGDYVWLFSGDDWMRPDAIRRVKARIAGGHDVVLCKHGEVLQDKSLAPWPVTTDDREASWNLADAAQRRAYFAGAANTEAFFSFMGNIVVKRATWNSAPLDERFVGTCFAHSARLLSLMPRGLTLQFVPEVWLNRRPDNDTFMSGGVVNRFRISIEGFRNISDALFGHDSVEAFHVRRTVRVEFGLFMLIYGKYMAWLDPAREDRRLMDRLVRTAYCEGTWNDYLTWFKYHVASVRKFRKTHWHFCEKHERAKGGPADPGDGTTPATPATEERGNAVSS